jgi:hypothetical protein
MIPEPLNGKKDDQPAPRYIAGHRFAPLSGMCEMTHSGKSERCNKVYSDISAAPKEAIDNPEHRGLWAAEGNLIEREWDEIQAENNRIFNCCRS